VRAETWAAFRILAEQAEPWRLRRPALRVFFFIAPELSHLDFRPVKQRSVSQELRVSQQEVSRALAALVRAEYLEEGEFEGPSKTYRLNLTQATLKSLSAA